MGCFHFPAFSIRRSKPQPLWGVPLREAAARSDPDHVVPSVVRVTVMWLDEHGLSEEGIYRVPGSRQRISRYRDSFNRGKAIAFPATEDVNTVAGVLKSYLRALPEPLVGRELAGEVDTLKSLPLPALDAGLCRLIARMAPENRETLRLLMSHLTRVAAHQSSNRMDSTNLMLCLNPALGIVFQRLIDRFDVFFGPSSPPELPVPVAAVVQASVPAPEGQAMSAPVGTIAGTSEPQSAAPPPLPTVPLPSSLSAPPPVPPRRPPSPTAAAPPAPTVSAAAVVPTTTAVPLQRPACQTTHHQPQIEQTGVLARGAVAGS